MTPMNENPNEQAVKKEDEIPDQELSKVSGGLVLSSPMQQAGESYQTADQRCSQQMNILSTILKTQNEMESTTNRSTG